MSEFVVPTQSQSVLIAESSVGLISNVIAEDAHAPLVLNFRRGEAVDCAIGLSIEMENAFKIKWFFLNEKITMIA